MCIEPVSLTGHYQIEYYKRGKIAQFRAVLDHALDPGTICRFRFLTRFVSQLLIQSHCHHSSEGAAVYGERFKNDRINILNALGGYYIRTCACMHVLLLFDRCAYCTIDRDTTSQSWDRLRRMPSKETHALVPPSTS